MAYRLERVVRGKPMTDGEFEKYIWHSELVDRIVATVIARRHNDADEGAQNFPLENQSAYIDTVI